MARRKHQSQIEEPRGSQHLLDFLLGGSVLLEASRSHGDFCKKAKKQMPEANFSHSTVTELLDSTCPFGQHQDTKEKCETVWTLRSGFVFDFCRDSSSLSVPSCAFLCLSCARANACVNTHLGPVISSGRFEGKKWRRWPLFRSPGNGAGVDRRGGSTGGSTEAALRAVLRRVVLMASRSGVGSS